MPNLFPYTNTHELNLDWILQVVKDFQTKYNGIDEALDAALEAIADARTGSLTDISAALNTALDAVTSAKAEAQSAIASDLENAQSAIASDKADAQAAIASDLEDALSELADSLQDTIDALDEHEAEILGRVTTLLQTLPTDSQEILSLLNIVFSVLNGNYTWLAVWEAGYYTGSTGVHHIIDDTYISTERAAGCAGRRLQVTCETGYIIYEISYWDDDSPENRTVFTLADNTAADIQFPATAKAFSITIRKSDSSTITSSDLQGNVTIEWPMDAVEVPSMIAYKETTTTASIEHTVGTASEFFMLNGYLYHALSDIAQYGSIVTSGSGQNVEAILVMDQVTANYSELKSAIDDFEDAVAEIISLGGESAQLIDPTKYVSGYRWDYTFNTNIDAAPLEDSGWTIVNQKWLIGDDKDLGFNYNSPSIRILGYRYDTQQGAYLRESTYLGGDFVLDGDHYKFTFNSNISALRICVVSSWLAELTTPLIMAHNSDWDGISTYGHYPSFIKSDVDITQVDDLAEAVEADIQNLQTISLGTLENGFINSAYGTAVPADTYKRTDYIHIQADKIKVAITFSVASVGFAFYDSRKKYISGFDYTGHNVGDLKTVTVPENAYYFRYCAINANVPLMQVLIPNYANAVSRIDANPCFYDLSSECRAFKKILCIGDSLTAGQFDYKENGTTKEFNDPDYAYPTFLKALTGRDTTNAGDAGETTVSWYALHGQEDFSGHDACIIMLGRNDYVEGRETTSEERATAFANIIAKVRTDNPQIQIFMATLINYYKGDAAETMNEDIRTAATANNCYLLDIATYGRMVLSDDAYSHCTAEGYYTLAEYFFRYISYIMHNNYTAFKTIQFTGTNRSYN